MGDYVDRKRLKEAIREDALNCLSCYNGEVLDLVLTEIDEAPAADVRPVVRGRWIKSHAIVGIDAKTCDVKIGETDKCSECGEEFVRPIKEYKFCPSCGADMRGGTSDG